MNFEKIIEQQIKLDEVINKEFNLSSNNNEKMLIALYTEIGEFANEVQSFKYWKKSKTINQDNLLEEYADGLHFLMSFAIKLKIEPIINPIVISDDINIQFLEMFNVVTKMSNKLSKKNVKKAISIYLGLATILKISDEKINEVYMLKNEKNFNRIKNNY